MSDIEDDPVLNQEEEENEDYGEEAPREIKNKAGRKDYDDEEEEEDEEDEDEEDEEDEDEEEEDAGAERGKKRAKVCTVSLTEF
jgi:transcription elongation factor SPT5